MCWLLIVVTALSAVEPRVAVCAMEDDFGFLSPELQQLTAGKQHSSQHSQQSQQQLQQSNQHSQLYSPHLFNLPSSRQTPPPSHSAYSHHQNVAPLSLSPSLGLSSFSSFPLSSPPSSSAAASASPFPLPDDLDGGLLPSDSYHQMLLSDVDLHPLGGANAVSPLASFDNPFLSSEAASRGSSVESAGGLGPSHALNSRLSHSHNVQPLAPYPATQQSAQNAQQSNANTAVKKEQSSSPHHSYSQLQQQQAAYSAHAAAATASLLSRYAAPAESLPSSSARSPPFGHGRSIDEYLAMHAQQQQMQQQQQQQQQQQAIAAAVAATTASSHSIGQLSSPPVSAAASLLSSFQSPSTFQPATRSPHGSSSIGRTISPPAPTLLSTGQYESSGFSFPPPPATLSAVNNQLNHIAAQQSPQQLHTGLNFAAAGYAVPSAHSPPSAVSSLVSAPPSTSPSLSHGHLRSRSGPHAAMSSPHAQSLSISPRMPAHSIPSHAHALSPSSAARSGYPPHLFTSAGSAVAAIAGGSASPSQSDTSLSLSPSNAARLQLQQAQFQRQMHAAQMHQLQQQQQHDFPTVTSAGQLYTQSPAAAYAQHNLLGSARPLNVNAIGAMKQEGGGGGGGLTIQPPPPTLTPSHPPYPLSASSGAATGGAASLSSSLLSTSIASNMLGAFNPGTFAAPAAKTAKAGNAAAKGGLKRTLTSSASTPSLTSLPAQQTKPAKGRGARGVKGSAERAGVPDVHRKKNRLARKAELARASRKRKKAYLGELEDEVTRLTVRIAQVEAVRFGQTMDAAMSNDHGGHHKRNESVSSASSSMSPLSALSSASPPMLRHGTHSHSAGSIASPSGVSESPHELQLDKLRIVELEAAPLHGQQYQQQPQQQRAHTEPSSAPPPSISPAFPSPSSDNANAGSIVSSLPRVQSDSNLSLSSSMSSMDALDSLPQTAASSFACTLGELVGRSQYFLAAIRTNFCPGDQEKFALFGFQQAAEIQAQQLLSHNDQPSGGAAATDSGLQQEEETSMADDHAAERASLPASSEPSDQSMAASDTAAQPSMRASSESAVPDARSQLSAASASPSPTSHLAATVSSPSASASASADLPSATAGPLPSSVSALHTFWLTLLRSELGVDETQFEQLRRMRDSVAPFTAQLRELESRVTVLQPTVLSHQHRMLEVRRRVRAVLSDEQFERLQRWLDKNDWVDHMLTSQIPALALAAQQQQHSAAQHSGHGGAAGSGMPRTASGTRLSTAANLSSAGRGGGGSDDDDDDDDDDDADSDDDDMDEQPAVGKPPQRKALHSRSMSIAEEKEEND